MKRVGNRIKTKRENLRMQVKDLSTMIGVTPSMISQIEKAKAYPSLITLKKLSEALNTTVSELLGEYEARTARPVMRSMNRKFVRKNDSNTTLYLLSNHDPIKRMEPYLVHFEPGGDSENIITSSYPCQEFCFVLKGEIDVKRGKNRYSLGEGDSFYFNSNEKHFFKNPGGKETELLWIVRLI